METKSTSPIGFIRSCKEESNKPIEGELKGEIPKWLEGNLIRVGSGLLEVGPDHYNHLFDGLALMHQFSFKNGKVTYMNKFLRSDTYRRNMKENRIMTNEFGTRGAPDPCKTIFQRYFSFFNSDERTDNDLVTIVRYSDEVYACSETNFIWKINPITLENIKKVKLSNFVAVDKAIAHAHEDTDGTVYNIGSTFGYKPNYKVMKVPPRANKNDDTFQDASIVCSIPSCKYFTVGYHHSFGMTENYFIFVEQPLYMSLFRMLAVHYFSNGAYNDAMYWDKDSPCRFHVIRRSDGKLLDTVYNAKSFFVFHHINAYEEDNCLVVDMCTYEDGEIVKKLYIQAMKDCDKNNKPFHFGSCATRYVLPLLVEGKKNNTNLVTLPHSKARAEKIEDGSIFCTSEVITDTDAWEPELPRINYEKFNGKKYKYFYALAHREKQQIAHVIKVDVETKTTLFWHEEGTSPSEPIFIPDPNADGEDEDFGVLVASLLYANDETKVSMLVLNAKTMQENGRVTFHTKSAVPGDFHGTFIPNK